MLIILPDSSASASLTSASVLCGSFPTATSSDKLSFIQDCDVRCPTASLPQPPGNSSCRLPDRLAGPPLPPSSRAFTNQNPPITIHHHGQASHLPSPTNSVFSDHHRQQDRSSARSPVSAASSSIAELNGLSSRPPSPLARARSSSITNNSIPATALNELKLSKDKALGRQEDEEGRGVRVYDPGYQVSLDPPPPPHTSLEPSSLTLTVRRSCLSEHCRHQVGYHLHRRRGRK